MAARGLHGDRWWRGQVHNRRAWRRVQQQREEDPLVRAAATTTLTTRTNKHRGPSGGVHVLGPELSAGGIIPCGPRRMAELLLPRPGSAQAGRMQGLRAPGRTPRRGATFTEYRACSTRRLLGQPAAGPTAGSPAGKRGCRASPPSSTASRTTGGARGRAVVRRYRPART